jgi:hypothetical protein
VATEQVTEIRPHEASPAHRDYAVLRRVKWI